MGAVQAMVLMTLVATAVFAATTEPIVSPTVQPAPYFYQSRWIPYNSDPGPPPPSNFYPHAPYIFPRAQGLGNTNPENTNPFQNSNGYQQPNGYPFAINQYGYGYSAYPPLYANPYQFFFPNAY